ncbi:outer membrane protein [Methylosinus sp. Sm6]|uniref:outer membrane protein n=1 Tax=Methylosinus sp. Sm6 TaxID=2866948 RepID=UPI001C9939C3|nr:outer membrane beta-barrel protein [Methylosinus sp. Sm6]MBY6241402.1 outer membrane beta-barrel protein [Methylosinus sp. Sm6]
MKRFLLGALLATTAHAAIAADLPSRKAPPMMPPPPPPPPVWTGFYLGANVGGGWLDNAAGRNSTVGWNGQAWVRGAANAADRSTSNGGVVGGGQVGYNYQLTPLFVVGLETDIQASNIGDNDPPFYGVTRAVDWFGTVRARAGVTLFRPDLLIYGTGGFAYGDIRLKHPAAFGGTIGQTGTGWTAGGGLEWLFAPNWSAKVEYLYTDIGASEWGGVNTFEQRVHIHSVRAGVNYHFNLFAPPPAPVVAKF